MRMTPRAPKRPSESLIVTLEAGCNRDVIECVTGPWYNIINQGAPMAERKTNRRGNYTMLTGFSIVGILGFGALGIDISYMSMANTQAAAVSDAASHAALLTFRQAPGDESARQTAGVTAANWIVDNNDVGFDGPGNLESIEFGIFNSSTGNFTPGSTPANAAKAQVTRTGGNGIELMLAPIIGVNKADIDQSGVTVANPREIVVVLDRSCSMGFGGNVGMLGADAAMEAFSQYMVDHQVPLDRIGATWFSRNGGWFDNLRYIDGNESSILTKWSEYGGWSTLGCTNQQAGISPATNALDSSGNDLAFKALIVISDGNPTCGSGSTGFTNSTSTAWSKGIHVWTVSFGSSINHSLMESAKKGLGTYERTPNASGLAAIMLKIAESIPVALVQ